MMQKPVAQRSPKELALFDHAAEITVQADACWPEPCEFYAGPVSGYE